MEKMTTLVKKRSKSADLVDLHVFVVPIESWLGKYSVAYNNVAVQSTSAGFIRVDPDATLSITRKWMLEQLDCDILPDKFVFLRSVGRCMAVVNQTQELNLKAKHFLPPVAYSPEIFILPGTHEWIASLRKHTESIIMKRSPSSQGYFGASRNSNYDKEMMNIISFNGEFSENENGIPKSGYGNTQDRKNENVINNKEKPQSLSTEAKKTDEEAKKGRSSEMLSEVDMSKKDQSRFSEVIRSMKKQPVHKQLSSISTEQINYDAAAGTDAISYEQNLHKIQNHVAPAIQVIHPEVLVHPISRDELTTPTPIPSANVIHSTLKFNHNNIPPTDMENGDEISSIAEQNNDQYHQKESFSYHSEDHGIGNNEDPDKSVNQLAFSLGSVPTGTQFEDNTNFDIAKDEDNKQDINELSGNRSDINPLESEELQRNDRYNAESKMTSRRVEKRKEEQRILDEEKMKMEDKKRSMEDDTLQLMKDMEELLQKKRKEEEKLKLEEEQRRRDAKEQKEAKKAEVSKLEEELIRAKDNRLELQKQREQFLKEAKETKLKIATKNYAEKNKWKKKYLEEKQRSVMLEEEINTIKEDIGEHQKKLLNKLDGKDGFEIDVEKTTNRIILGPSQLNNLKNDVQRLMNEIGRLQIDIDKAKGMLKNESKRKTDAEKQLKVLRSELSEKRKVISLPKTENDVTSLQKQNDISF